jgi:mannose-1-phosphate guanylyltransferase/mannose-6-phosphate isomerase
VSSAIDDNEVRDSKGSANREPALALAIAPVILAGGAGTRLWPVSRKHYPKQLVGVLGDMSLLQTTALRLAGLSRERPVRPAPIVVCGEEYRHLTSQQLHESGIDAYLIVEPSGRNTAPALTMAALLASAAGDDAILVAMPADHSIAASDAFQRAVLTAADFAVFGPRVGKRALVTFVSARRSVTGCTRLRSSSRSQRPKWRISMSPRATTGGTAAYLSFERVRG